MTTPLRRPVRAAAVLAALLLTALTSLTISLSWAQPAAAHTSLVSSDPADGASLEVPPSEVGLTFSEELREPAFVTVRQAGRAVTADEPAEVDGADVSVPVVAEAAGAYTIAYRVVSADGHPIEGELTFQARDGASDPTPDPAPQPSDEPTDAADDASDETPATSADTEPAARTTTDSGSSTWVVVGIGAGVAIAVAVLLGVARRRGSS